MLHNVEQQNKICNVLPDVSWVLWECRENFVSESLMSVTIILVFSRNLRNLLKLCRTSSAKLNGKYESQHFSVQCTRAFNSGGLPAALPHGSVRRRLAPRPPGRVSGRLVDRKSTLEASVPARILAAPSVHLAVGADALY